MSDWDEAVTSMEQTTSEVVAGARLAEDVVHRPLAVLHARAEVAVQEDVLRVVTEELVPRLGVELLLQRGLVLAARRFELRQVIEESAVAAEADHRPVGCGAASPCCCWSCS